MGSSVTQNAYADSGPMLLYRIRREGMIGAMDWLVRTSFRVHCPTPW